MAVLFFVRKREHMKIYIPKTIYCPKCGRKDWHMGRAFDDQCDFSVAENVISGLCIMSIQEKLKEKIFQNVIVVTGKTFFIDGEIPNLEKEKHEFYLGEIYEYNVFARPCKRQIWKKNCIC